MTGRPVTLSPYVALYTTCLWKKQLSVNTMSKLIAEMAIQISTVSEFP